LKLGKILTASSLHTLHQVGKSMEEEEEEKEKVETKKYTMAACL
jgi:hypothetical protein